MPQCGRGVDFKLLMMLKIGLDAACWKEEKIL